MPGTRKLGRTSDHRKAMLRGMVTFLLENGKVETTVTRAKEVRAMTEKYITLAKDNSLHSKRQAMAFVTKEAVVKKLRHHPQALHKRSICMIWCYIHTTSHVHI